MPLDSGEIAQLTDVQPRKRDPRDTDSQKFIKAEEQKLIEHTRIEAEKKKKAEEKDKARALPKCELADRQSATDLQLSPDGTHVFILDRRAHRDGEAAQRAELRHRIELHGRHSRADLRRRRAGQAHAGDHESGNRQDVSADAGFAGRFRSSPRRTARRSRARSAGACRRFQTTARWPSRTCAPTTTKTAGWSSSIPSRARAACSTRCTTTPGCARSAASDPNDPSFGWLPDQKHVWFLSERDGWMHLYSRRRHGRSVPAARQLTQGKWEIESVSSVARQEEVLHHQHRGASGRAAHLRDAVDGGARTKLTSMTGGSAGEVVARRQHVRDDLFVQHQAARGLPDAEPRRRRRRSR